MALRDGGRVMFQLSFDEHCVMAIDARDVRSGRSLAVRLDRTRDVGAVLRELGKYDGPDVPVTWQPPTSRVGRVLGKLFALFGR
jgi:hypothetical protein